MFTETLAICIFLLHTAREFSNKQYHTCDTTQTQVMPKYVADLSMLDEAILIQKYCHNGK